ncbi:nitroreductase family protein [Candidatus Woesearchaeota archaeon]|nr:nitroreductase family protein [Candidatus Woesearchaeota archaeon]
MSSRKNTDLIEVIEKRRSVRRFLEKDVSNNLINKVIRAAAWAPSTCNQQLWNFIVIKDKRTKSRLINEAASSTLVGRAPAVIIITYEKSNYKEAIQSATAAMQNLLLAAAYHGLGSCAINSFGNGKKIKEILEIPDDQMIVCFVVLGYKDPKFYSDLSPPPRRETSSIVHLGKFKKRGRNIFSYDPDKWTLEEIKDYQKYYCRKTYLGKEMDITTKEEKGVVARYLKNVKSPVLDWLTYDGTYLQLFPDKKIFAADLTEETSNYTKATAKSIKGKKPDINCLTYDASSNKLKAKNKKFGTVTSVYKFERIPKKDLIALLKETYRVLEDNGEFIIIFRKKSLLYRIFYSAIISMFGDDIRKTGIYAFFGPYKPLHSKKFVVLLKKAGFTQIKKECYFPFPPFFDQAYQMLLQHKKSGGTSYLHRIRKHNLMTKLISFLINIYGSGQIKFGNICVITAKK